MKRIISLLIIMAVAFALCTCISAAQTVTVDKSTTFAKAVKALGGDGGTIVIAEPITLSGEIKVPEQEADLKITGEAITLSGNLIFEKNENNNTITIDAPINGRGSYGTIFGGFNNIVFTDKASGTGKIDFYGGVITVESSGGTSATDAAEKMQNEAGICTLPYSITVNGGNFGVFVGGNYRETYSAMLGSIAAPITITINGGTFGNEIELYKSAALKIVQTFSISGMSILADAATLNINGGTFNAPIYAQGYIGQTSVTTSGNSQVTRSDAKYYAADGDIKINIKGGTFNCSEISATQSAATYSQVLRGNYTVTVDKKATFSGATLFDATQVKAYKGESKKASITYSGANITAKRFDTENGKSKKYDEPIRIAFIGDSITQGSNAYDGGVLTFERLSYPAQFLEKAIASGRDVVVSNYGCSATRIMDYDDFAYRDGLAYTLSMNETDADFVVVALGTNDSLACTKTYGMKDRFVEEYTEFIKGYEALPETDAVYGTSAIYRDNRDAAAVSMRGLQEQVFTTLKKEGLKCTYVDLYALLLDSALSGKLLSSDQLHPNAAGYTIYADRLYDALFNGVLEVKDFEMTDIYVDSRGKLTGKGTKDDPTKSLAVAFAKAAPEATIHIVGNYSYTKLDNAACGLMTPTSVKKLTLKGEGDNATLKVSTKYIFINSDITFDNITVTSTASPLHFVCGYNNVTFSETFKSNGAYLIAGFLTFADNKKQEFYNSYESVCSDKDCTININGGDFAAVIGGNLSGNASAVFGTYGGDLVINIGKGATVTDKSNLSGATGQNYLTGTATLNVSSWASDRYVRAYAPIGTSRLAKEFDLAKNTGKATVNASQGVKVAPLGDLNENGLLDISDLVFMSANLKIGSVSEYSNNFYGVSSFKKEYLDMLLYDLVK